MVVAVIILADFARTPGIGQGGGKGSPSQICQFLIFYLKLALALLNAARLIRLIHLVVALFQNST